MIYPVFNINMRKMSAIAYIYHPASCLPTFRSDSVSIELAFLFKRYALTNESTNVFLGNFASVWLIRPAMLRRIPLKITKSRWDASERSRWNENENSSASARTVTRFFRNYATIVRVSSTPSDMVRIEELLYSNEWIVIFVTT